tara:strand:+ start:270 stop:647 length:378 start_codon:yes stop_codon:yes gene_type:complete
MGFISNIKAGDFNIRLKLKYPVISTNTFGERVESSFPTLTTVWGIKKITSLRNINEKFEGDQLQSYGLFFIQIRYTAQIATNIDPTFKIVDDSTNEEYELLSYIIDPRKEYIELYVKLDINTSIS